MTARPTARPRAVPDPASALTALLSAGGNRGRPRKLDRAAVAEVALEIVERDGLAGLTMRRAAEKLGVGLATLYNAVGDKETMLDDMIEAVFNRLPEGDATPGSELENLVRLWVATHELLVANPVVAQLIAVKRFGGTGLFALVESTFALLSSRGVHESLMMTAFETIRAYALGFSLLRISRSDPAASHARDRLTQATAAVPEQYPQINARATEMASALTAERFELGLRHLVGGFVSPCPVR